MKPRKIVWSILLVATALTCWLSFRALQQAPQARVKVENDIADVSRTSSTKCVAYDPYFIQQNSTPDISVALK